MSDNTKDKDCLDPDNNNKFCFFKVANAFLMLANLLLIFLGFHYLPTCLSQDSSYFSVIVAVLAILVTVLVTWQIYSLINLETKIKDINNAVERRIKEAVEACRVPLEGEITYLRADRWRRQGIKEKDTMAFELAYGYYLDALECFIKYPKKDSHEELLEYFKDVIEVGKIAEWLSEEKKEKGVRIISKAESRNKNEVLKMLLTIEIGCPTTNIQTP